MMMHSCSKKFLKTRSVILLALLATLSLSCTRAPGNQSDVDWLIEVLNIGNGSVVADIGAGDGDQTVAIARQIGPEGKIYSTELGDESVEELQKAVAQSDSENIVVLEGHPDRTNLSEECCNAIFMRRVYHHLKNPDFFNKSLFESLKPGGRLAIIDFKPFGSEADPKGRDSGSQHGVTAETVVEELQKAGFTLVSSEHRSIRNIYVVMQKPAEK